MCTFVCFVAPAQLSFSPKAVKHRPFSFGWDCEFAQLRSYLRVWIYAAQFATLSLRHRRVPGFYHRSPPFPS